MKVWLVWRGDELREAVAEAISIHSSLGNMVHAAISCVVEACAQVAVGNCVCEPFWAQYGKRDPKCVAHDIEDSIRELAPENAR